MSIKIVEGSLLDSNAQYICHQVNCQGKMNSGIAKAIREKWPRVYENYRAKFEAVNDYTQFLSDIQIVALYDDYYTTNKHQYVINMFSQYAYGYDGKRYTSYDAFWVCLHNIKTTCQKGSTIAFPYGIGCVRGGANWNIIYKMIEEVLGQDYEVEIWRLDRG